jgi:hypothetical protein
VLGGSWCRSSGNGYYFPVDLPILEVMSAMEALRSSIIAEDSLPETFSTATALPSVQTLPTSAISVFISIVSSSLFTRY